METKNNTPQAQVVSDITHRAYFSGTHDECQKWIIDYGLGNSQFSVFPFSKSREYGDIMETY